MQIYATTCTPYERLTLNNPTLFFSYMTLKMVAPTGKINISRKQLSKLWGYQLSNVDRIMNDLEATGLVQVISCYINDQTGEVSDTSKPGFGRGVNTYVLAEVAGKNN